jgi:hypothetical protein
MACYLRSTSLGANKESNWLPTPPQGAFNGKYRSVGEDAEATCAGRAFVNWCVSEHKRRARSNEGAYVGQEMPLFKPVREAC